MRRTVSCGVVLCVFIAIAVRATPPAPTPPGRLVDLGGYRLHALVRGARGPTVVFLNGAGDYSFVWALVQPAVSRFARTVTYDRAGDAWSDLGPTPRTMRQESFELHLLLTRLGVRPPVVLVGHSYGGLLARVYAERYSSEVAGVVLVDSTHESTVLGINGKPVRLRELASGQPIPPVQSMASSPPRPPSPQEVKEDQEMRAMFGPPKIDAPYDRLPPAARRLQLWAMTNTKLAASVDNRLADELALLWKERASQPRPLGDRPLVAIAGGKASGPPPGVDAAAWAQIVEEKAAQKADLATLSSDGVLVVDERSGHHVQLEDPKTVVAAIRRVVVAVRSGRPLRSAP